MNSPTAYSPLRFGLPAGICLTGMSALLWPGSSAATLVIGWALVYTALALLHRSRPWSSTTGGWVLWGASIVLWTGICINCNYFIIVLGNGDSSAPVLMNIDAWSAWNNALFDNGRTDVMACGWPAQDYGHLIGAVVRVFGQDFGIALMFNSFCALLTIVLAGDIAARCGGGDARHSRDIAVAAMAISAAMCYFMASATVLIKDCPLACAVAITAAASLRLRDKASLGAVAAIVIAAIGVYFMRKNYFPVLAVLILCLSDWRRRRSLVLPALVSFALLAAWANVQLLGEIAPVSFYVDHGGQFTTKTPINYGHGDDYNHNLTFYFSAPLWVRLLLLPAVTAVQFLIPLPWSFDKYLIYGPFMAVAHFSFFRYVAGCLLMYYTGRQFRDRAPRLLTLLTVCGLVFYIASAYSYGGSVARYGIPLITLLTPSAAYAWVHYRRERAFRIWCVIFAVGMSAALTLAYVFTA